MKKYVTCRIVATAPLSVVDRAGPVNSCELAIVARPSKQGLRVLSRRELGEPLPKPLESDPNTALRDLLFSRTYGCPAIPTGRVLNIAV